MKIKKLLIIDDIGEMPDEIIVKYKGVDFVFCCPVEPTKDNPRPLPSTTYIEAPQKPYRHFNL